MDDQPPRLTKAEILAVDDIEEREVQVPQWHTSVTIRSFTKRQVDRMRLKATGKDRAGKDVLDRDLFEALLFTEGVVDPKFDLDDYDAIQEKSAIAVGIIARAIVEVSGLSEAAVEAATKSPAGQSNGALRILPGARAEDDAGGTASADVGA